MDDLLSRSDSDYSKYWIDWFLGIKGNEFFCEIDEEYIQDKFNLTGINTEVQHYNYAIDMVTDVFDHDVSEDLRDQVEKSAQHLYGLIHARFILTSRGLQKMLEKYKKYDFGCCPRVFCHSQALLPIGLSDIPNSSSVKLYCIKCEDIYTPKSSRHATIDGAYFGTTFPHIMLQVYPYLIPQRSQERYVPRIFGFKIREYSIIHQLQDIYKKKQDVRLDTIKENEDMQKNKQTL
ncbi:unnamed protein product [Pneumocystis jirovecii]|uniref:Casein kinase II subunit beta n=2 Tax=Pneumocystis jirovecii TaxID=42068 RepID=L0PAQ7_PNEJI|nr:uncharacterized protein T551_01241 [Pneumocystis jirovecii RU7]KTW31168.1 hypothetical protein T551_01241 [Pneumocystis jirovecii RU7]CCJ29438.1 unnamed protein product [Pneumocystis jirovecii]